MLPVSEIKMRGVRCGELVPTLAAQPFGAHVVTLQELDGQRIDLASRVAASAKSPKTPLADLIKDGLAQDAAG